MKVKNTLAVPESTSDVPAEIDQKDRLDIGKLQSAIDKAMSLRDFKAGAGELAKFGSAVGTVEQDSKMMIDPDDQDRQTTRINIFGRDLSAGERRVNNNKEERGAHTSLQAGPSPRRTTLANIISEEGEDNDCWIDELQMDKISQKLNLDFQKFKSMNKESQKDVEQVILDYKLQLTQDAQFSGTFSSALRTKNKQISTDPRWRNFS